MKKVGFFEDRSVIMAACSENASCALTNQGSVFHWGKGQYSKHCENSRVPGLLEAMQPQELRVSAKNPVKFVKIAGGASHFAAIDAEARLFTWGDW